MRRCTALKRLPSLFGAALLLSGCHYASSPLVGFPGFIGDTHTFANSPNSPRNGIENIRRASGQAVPIEPLMPEPGNVWPGPPTAEPTLADMQKQQNQENQVLDNKQNQNPGPATPHRQPRGSSTPPGAVQTQPSPPPSPQPFQPSFGGPAPATLPPPVINTPGGSLIPNNSVGGSITATHPGGGTSLVVPNGNGTSTVIGPDGATSTIPTPR